MYTLPVSFLSDDSTQRCFVKFTYDGLPHRLYNGNALAIACFPNRKKTLPDKKKELQRLLEATYKALQAGWYPGQVIHKEPTTTLQTSIEALKAVQLTFSSRDWSTSYKRDMKRIANELNAYLTVNKFSFLPIGKVTGTHLSRLLDNYRSSGRYYMNKRRNLSALFAHFVRAGELATNPVEQTPAEKTNEILNEAFTPEQLMGVLTHLQVHHENLYLCALLTYGTLLRPHREIRLLRRRNLDEQLNCITLAGGANKSGRIRKVPIPDYVRQELLRRNVHLMAPEAFIFTSTEKPLNPDYFTTAWSRQKRLMLIAKLILPTQTLYSFRHSAAIYSFTTRQNLRLLQGLMGHATPDVSLKYLRSLGITDISSTEDLPRLPDR